MFSILILTASIGQADPPRIQPPDPPPIERRVKELETRVAELERLLGKPKVSASPPSAIVVPPGHHAHRRSDGTVYTHGNENVGNAAAHQGVAYPWPRIAEAGQTVTQTTTAATVQTYTIQQSSCPNGQCPTSSGSSRWYLGKNLGR